MSSLGAFGTTFQEATIQALLTDKQFAEQMIEVADASYFDLKYLTFLYERYSAYAKKYKAFPSFNMLITIIKDELKIGADLALRDKIIDYLKRIKSNPNPGDLQFAKDKALEFCRKQALKKALLDSVDKIEQEKYETIAEDIKRACMVGTAPQEGHDFFKDLDARFSIVQRCCVATGLGELDKKGVLNGGLGRGELGVVLGGTGTGKCSSRDTYINVRYALVVIDGKRYKPWEKILTMRGEIYAKDIVVSDELM